MADEKRDEAQQAEEPHDDLELPEETAEEVKGGGSIKAPKKSPIKNK